VFRGKTASLPPDAREDFRSRPAPRHLRWFWPRSNTVEVGVVYSFEATHCGLEFLTDFGGVFWHPVPPIRGREPSFFYNSDHGRMVRLSKDWAAFESSTGDEC
jgi:hypothetical protein